MAVSIRMTVLAIAALAASLTVQPASAQQGVQRIPVSSILARLDRLETDLTLMRQAPGGIGDEMATRIDQLETELRRLTGIIERLEYDLTQQAEISEKRALDLETRLQALESQRPAPLAARPAPPPGPLATAPALAPPPAPFAQDRPTVKLGGEPAVAFGTPRQIDVPPDLGALPFPAVPPATTGSLGQGVAVAGAGVTAPAAAALPPVPAPPPPPGDPQAQYDEALRMLNLGEFESAGAALETLVTRHPEHAVSGSAKYWLGDMHLRLGRYNEAAKAFLESFRGWPEGPKAPDSLLKLGMTLAGLGQREEACLTFTEFPGRYPNASPTLLRRAQIEAERTQCGG